MSEVANPVPPAVVPTAPASLLDGYRPLAAGSNDELLNAAGEVRPAWRPFLKRLEALGLAGLTQRAEQARRLLRENGVSYNVVGAPQGPERPWELDPLPLLIDQNEWQLVANGIQQRAALLNAIAADIYGPQRLLKERIVPPGMIFDHLGCLLPCRNLLPRGGHVTLYAGNLVRGRDGRWLVLGDRTQGPSGVGYVVENRIVISRTLPTDFESLHIPRLAGFFKTMRETLPSLAPKHRDNPRVVLLSPGPSSSRYFEDGYLARYLGYSLVEGGDLTVRGDSVYLKTLGGLIQVDVILRRIPDNDCDPLELRADSLLGTPGMLQAARSRQVALANGIGSGMLEAPVFSAYLPKICRFLFQQDLKLPCNPTWWCGDAESWKYIEANFDRLLIRPAFVHRNITPTVVAALSLEQRTRLLDQIRERPSRYVAQQPIERSTAPLLTPKGFVPARVSLRVFATAAGDGFDVLPGGLCRVSTNSGLNETAVDSASGGQSSKDVWILSDKPVEPVSLLTNRAATAVELRRSANDLPSRVADNLYWLGRYVERAEAAVRQLRTCVVRLTDELEPSGLPELIYLVSAMSDEGSDLPDFDELEEAESIESLRKEVLSRLSDANRPGSLAHLLQIFQATAAGVRDRVSVDSWRIVNQLELAVLFPGKGDGFRLGEVLLLLNQLLNLLAAFGGLGTESMTHGPGWRFLDMGRRIERALQLLHIVKRILVEPQVELTPLLEAVLEIADSSMTYRHRYFASLQLAPLLDLVLVDETNPRAIGYQLNALSEHVEELPVAQSDPGRSREQKVMLSAQAVLRLTDVDALCEKNEEGRREQLHKFVTTLEEHLRHLSDSVTHHYLTHTAPTRQLGALIATEA